jgi:hypothetical protein
MSRVLPVAAATFLAALPARADGPGIGCLAIERVEAAGGVCRASVRNACDRPLRITVRFAMESLGFSPNPIPPGGLEADHHGEPAYGGYSPPAPETGAEEATLAPGESRIFTRTAGAGRRFVTSCRVRVTTP